MEQTKKYRGLWWLVCLASTAALIIAIVTHWEWLTLILPFQTTAYVKLYSFRYFLISPAFLRGSFYLTSN